MGDSIRPNSVRIDELRIGRLLTKTELARLARISPVTMSRVSQGQPVALRTLRRLADALTVEPSEIVESPEKAGRASERGPVAAGAA